MMRTALIGSIALLTFVLPIQRVRAAVTPAFPSCLNPGGSVLVHHAGGTHGIVGSTDQYIGADTVYSVGEGLVVQCFCPADGNGIQTNWWNASGLTGEELDILTHEGWTLVPDGSLWGLGQGTYLAKNLRYNCLPTGGGSTGGGGSQQGDGLSDGRSSCPECTAPPAIGGGEILGTSTGDILGLAATGDSWKLWGIFAASLTLLLSGIRTLTRK